MRLERLAVSVLAVLLVAAGCQGESDSVTVPNVVGLRESAAVETVTAAGLQVLVRRRPYVVLRGTRVIGPRHTVLAQSPAAGANVAHGTTMTIVVRFRSGSNTKSAPPPVLRNGPMFIVASGHDWSLRAWQSNAGLCISYRPLTGGTVCHVRVPKGGSLYAFVRNLKDRTLVVGAVPIGVARVERTVETKDARGVSEMRLYRPPAALGTRLRFFRSVVTGEPRKWRIAAYDRQGRQVGSVGQ